MKRRFHIPSVRGGRGRRSWRGVGVLFLALAALSMATTSCTPPATLTLSNVVTGINRPWDLAFTPDGTLLFTQKGGTINGFIGGTVRTFTGQPADVRSIGEGGMMGLAVDPQFATNRRIYTCFLSNLGTFPTNTSGNLDVRVVRWTLDAGYNALGGRTDIVTNLPVNPSQTGRHSGCRPRFGPDGNLYIGTGDAATGTNPQNKTSLGGKVLRVTPDGAGVAGNPGVDSPASGFLPQIYTYGHRNVQGIAFRPHDGQAFSIEHGTGCDDEVNRLSPGANYGWDPIPGYNESRPMTDLVKFPAAIVATWSSGCPTIAPSGGTFVTGPQWAGWDNNLIVAVLKDHHLRTMIVTVDGTDAPFEFQRVDDQGRLRSAVQGPDGNLYVATDTNPGKIFRVTPTP